MIELLLGEPKCKKKSKRSFSRHGLLQIIEELEFESDNLKRPVTHDLGEMWPCGIGRCRRLDRFFAELER